MKIKCAYCSKDLGEKEPYNDKSTSHTICQDCLAKELAKMEGTHDRPRNDLPRKRNS